MGKIYCLNEKIEQSVDGYLKTIHNPIYFTVKSVYEKAFSSLSMRNREMFIMSEQELTFFVHFVLEKIRTIREITTLHPTHISYLAQKLGDYIVDMNKVARGTLKIIDITHWTYRILLTTCILLSRTEDLMLKEFAKNAIIIIRGMYISSSFRTTVTAVDELFRQSSTQATPLYVQQYSMANKLFFFNNLNTIKEGEIDFVRDTEESCIFYARNVSEVIQEHIFRISVDDVNEKWIFSQNPYVHWENLINSIKKADNTDAINKFLGRVIRKQKMDSHIRTNIEDALGEKIDNIDEQITIKPVNVTLSPTGDLIINEAGGKVEIKHEK